MIKALKALPEEIRWTLLLVDVEGMEQAAAGEILGVPEGTVKSRAFRGRRMLREILLAADGSSKEDGL
jgi:RNA polymerase sigma-70 factor (ECF subfamily)